MSFHNEEQKAACLSSCTGEEALAPGFSPTFMGTNCTPPRTDVALSLNMPFLIKCGQVFESLYTTFSGYSEVFDGKRSVCQCGETPAVTCAPVFFFFEGGNMVQHHPTMLCLGWSSPNPAVLQ